MKNKTLEKKYAVRNFKTTKEAIKFMKIVIPFMQKIQDKDIKNAPIETMLELLDEKPLSFVIETFCFKKGKQGEKNTPVKFDDFKEDFQTLFSLFLMATSKLTAKMGGKPQAPKEQGKIVSKRLET